VLRFTRKKCVISGEKNNLCFFKIGTRHRAPRGRVVTSLFIDSRSQLEEYHNDSLCRDVVNELFRGRWCPDSFFRKVFLVCYSPEKKSSFDDLLLVFHYNRVRIRLLVQVGIGVSSSQRTGEDRRGEEHTHSSPGGNFGSMNLIVFFKVWAAVNSRGAQLLLNPPSNCSLIRILQRVCEPVLTRAMLLTMNTHQIQRQNRSCLTSVRSS